MEKNKEALPVIALDGANIACAFMGHEVPGDAVGIVKAYRHFADLGHEVVAFVKQFRMNEKNPKQMLRNLNDLYKGIPKKSMAVVPARSDDDSFFIDYCIKNSAVLITQDGLKDHENRLQGKEKDAFMKWRATHRCEYMFAMDQFMPNPNFKMPDSPTKKGSEKKEKSANSSPTRKSKKRSEDDLKQVLAKNMESQFKVHSLGTDLVEWCNSEWKTSFSSSKEIRKHVGLPSSPSMTKILERLFKDEVRFSGKGQNVRCTYTPAKPVEDTHKGWLLQQMDNWIRLSGLGNKFSQRTGGRKPKLVLKEMGASGKNMEEMLKSLYGKGNLEFRGLNELKEVRRIKRKVKSTKTGKPSKKMEEGEAMWHVLQIIGLPENWKAPNLLNRITSLFKGKSQFSGQMNYAKIGQEFVEGTGHKLTAVFREQQDLVNRINSSGMGLKARFDGNSLVVNSR